MSKRNKFLWFDYVAVAIIVMVFFIISYCGFYNSDDLAMAYGSTPTGFEKRIAITSIFDVFKLTWWWYFHLGGRLFSVAAQYFFCGLLGNKAWFDIVNTLFFMLLIIVNGKLINTNDNKDGIRYVLIFALLFWFLCPKPCHSLFWTAGATTYLWSNTLSFVFLLLFQKYKKDNFGIIEKLGLFLISIFAASEFITCVSICGAFLVYYAFHIKEFKGNVVPFVVGFAVGSMFLLFAPGNFIRYSLSMNTTFFDRIKEVMFNPIQEIIKYKALWIFLIILVLGGIKNKMIVKTWIRNNAVLLLALGWSVIAFSVVFRPATRALFFTETLSLILFLRFLFDNYHVFGIRFLDEFISHKNSIVWRAIIVLLLIVFILDSAFAITETKKQSKNNDVILNKIVDSRGIVVSDQMISTHRMAYAPSFPKWTWKPLADRFGLDFVRIYPFYCQEKFYKRDSSIKNTVVLDWEEDAYVIVRIEDWLVMRIENKDLQQSDNHITFTINYSRPRKWYKSWLNRVCIYQYDRTVVFEKYEPDIDFDDYWYYVFWINQENELKSFRYEFE